MTAINPKPKKPKLVPAKQQARIVDVASAIRLKLFPENQPIDAEKVLDSLYDEIPGFDWFVGNEHFEGMQDVVAYAKFDDGRQIFLKDEVYDALRVPGTENT